MGIALEINEDIDLVRMDEPCRLGVRQGANVNKAVERGTKPRPHRTVVIGTVGISEHFEAVAIVALEQFGHQLRRRMLMKISGQIAKTNALLLDERLVRKDGFRQRPVRPDSLVGAGKLV